MQGDVQCLPCCDQCNDKTTRKYARVDPNSTFQVLTQEILLLFQFKLSCSGRGNTCILLKKKKKKKNQSLTTTVFSIVLATYKYRIYAVIVGQLGWTYGHVFIGGFMGQHECRRTQARSEFKNTSPYLAKYAPFDELHGLSNNCLVKLLMDFKHSTFSLGLAGLWANIT